METLVIGVSTGATLALMALGLTLIFGVMRTINFAHGEFYMLGGYAYVLAAAHSLPAPVAVATAPLAAFAVGWLIHRSLLATPRSFRRINYANRVMLITFAVSVILQNSAVLLAGGQYYRPPSILPGLFSIHGVTISGDRLVGALGATVGVGLLWFVMSRTRIGRAWRAIIQNRTGAQVVGINITQLTRSAFAFACALAGLAGGLVAPLLSVFPADGVSPVTASFVIIIIGGMGSIVGSLVGGVTVGLLNAIGEVYVSPNFTDVYGFLLLVVLLIIRPTGLFGERAERF